MAEIKTNPNGSKSETPKKWDSPKDINQHEGADQHPNIWRKRTRSGHVLEFNDGEGAEHVTMQHRTGSKIQFKPDGAIEFTSHNGEYHITFGEKRMKITGAYDITVDGAASLKVNKAYNLTVAGDMNFTVEKDFNLTAKNMNQTVRENLHTVAKNQTTKVDEAINVEAQTHTLTAEKGMTVQSTADSVIVSGKKDAGLRAGQNAYFEAEEGKLTMKAKTEATFEGEYASFKGKTLAIEASENGSIKAGQVMVVEGAKKLHIQSDEELHAKAPMQLGIWSGDGTKGTIQNTKTTVSPKTIKYAATKTTVTQTSSAVG